MPEFSGVFCLREINDQTIEGNWSFFWPPVYILNKESNFHDRECDNAENYKK